MGEYGDLEDITDGIESAVEGGFNDVDGGEEVE